MALLLAAGPAEAQPVVDLLTRFTVPADETAASAPEVDSPQGSGKKLAELEANLVLVAEGLEAFAHLQDADKSLRAARPRLPEQIAPFFRDRAAALDSLYRTLAVVDYTWALRFPEPPCAPADRRAALLRSSDGLFLDPVSGRTSSWMEALLGPNAKGENLESALDRASASAAPSQADYARLRARQKLITLALSSESAEGKARAKLYCQRAEIRVALASANRTAGPVLAARSSGEGVSRRGIVIVAGTNDGNLEVRGAGAIIDTPSGVRVLTDRRLGGGQLAALVEGKSAPVSLSVEREDESSGLLLLRPEGDVGEATAWSEAAPKKGDLVSVVAHSERLGAWTRSQGLVTSAAAAQFQADAIADASMTGGGVFDEEGRLAGLLVLRPAAGGRGDWPAAVPAPALRAWASGGPAPEAGPASLEDAGTTKILTASRPLLDSLPGAQSTEARRADDIFTPTPWGTVRGRCMANCEIDDGAPSSGYGGGDGSRELGEALGKLAAVGMQALIFKGIPALFRGIGSLFKRKPLVQVQEPVPSTPVPLIVEKKPEPPKPDIKCELKPVDVPASVRAEKAVVKVQLSCVDLNGIEKNIDVSNQEVSFDLRWEGQAAQYENIEAVTDANGIASFVFRVDNEITRAERSFEDLDRYDPDKRDQTPPDEQDRSPVLQNAGRGLIETGDAKPAVSEKVSKPSPGSGNLKYALIGTGMRVRIVARGAARAAVVVGAVAGSSAGTAGAGTVGSGAAGVGAGGAVIGGSLLLPLTGLVATIGITWGLYKAVEKQDRFNESIDMHRDEKPKMKKKDKYAPDPECEDTVDIPIPGDCSQEMHRQLQIDVDLECGNLDRCDAEMTSCDEISNSARQFEKCIAARNRIDNQCFRGGDRNHCIQLKSVTNGLIRCQMRAREQNCP
ncbi:MAG: hypothetical protein HYX59_02505 [Elusimicrobia bacterium]|nr:hypothetical protein [Elusimicrobiota bacterium]